MGEALPGVSDVLQGGGYRENKNIAQDFLLCRLSTSDKPGCANTLFSSQGNRTTHHHL